MTRDVDRVDTFIQVIRMDVQIYKVNSVTLTHHHIQGKLGLVSLVRGTIL